jgi:hypothetical protein
MCERHSQAPPMLGGPKGDDKSRGRSGLIANKLPSPLIYWYPEPRMKRGQRVALQRCMSCSEVQSKNRKMSMGVDSVQRQARN